MVPASAKTAYRPAMDRYAWPFIVLLAAILWSVHLTRPFVSPSWHEVDYSSIARNFVREGSNIAFPRIDWRRDGPGFTEMEFPIIPWAISRLYLIFGINETIGRVLSLAFMLASLCMFRMLALKFLPESVASVAALFFIVSHEITIVATAVQPESLMLLCSLSAVFYFVDWYDSKSWWSYLLATVSFAVAILVKSPAAHLAIFFFIWSVIQDGANAFRKPSLYFFATLSFAPGLLWYSHAASLWHQFHNSMGVSNEYHWIGLDLLLRLKVIANFVSIELIFVFGIGGALVVVAGVLRDRLSSRLNQLCFAWCFAVVIYLVVILRTSAFYWASYYHVVAVPPVALLFAAGVYQLRAQGSFKWRWMLPWLAIAAIMMTACLHLLQLRDVSHLPSVFQDLAAGQSGIPMLCLLVISAIAATLLCLHFAASYQDGLHRPSPSKWKALALVLGCFVYFFVSDNLLLGKWKTELTPSSQFEAISCLRGKVPANTLIVASGGICVDPTGHAVANDRPDMFYWLDRKGFTTCEGQQTISELQSFHQRGASYFVADQNTLNEQPGFEAELRHSFRLVTGCKSTLLFDLNEPR